MAPAPKSDTSGLRADWNLVETAAFQAGAIRPGYRVKIGGLTGEKAGKLNGEVASVVERAEVGDGWVVLTDPKPSNAFIGELKKLKDDNLEALDVLTCAHF